MEILFENGKPQEALALFEKIKDIPVSSAWLARIYRDGKGIPKNLKKAEELMSFAASKNVQWAKVELETLKNLKN